jgi:hypothetical protein
MHNEEIGDKDLDRQRMLARNQILLYGSDGVIKAYDKWVMFTDNGGKGGSDEDVALFGNLLLNIRQDIVGKTKVTVGDISNLNPFKSRLNNKQPIDKWKDNHYQLTLKSKHSLGQDVAGKEIVKTCRVSCTARLSAMRPPSASSSHLKRRAAT